MNPLNCKLGFANPFFLSVSCKSFAFVCFLYSVERTLLMDSGQLKFAACLRSSCCSTSTPAGGPCWLPAVEGSCRRAHHDGIRALCGFVAGGKWSCLKWKHSIHCFPSSEHGLPCLENVPGKVSPPFWEGKNKPCQAQPSGALTLLCHD